MNKQIGIVTAILLGLLGGAAPAGAASKLKVVASLPNLGSIARAIGGDRIDLTVIGTGTQDAHFVDPKPSFMVKMRNADLLLINGLDLEIGWIPPLTQGARNAKILQGAAGFIDCSTGIRVVEVPPSLSRAEGDVHPYGNPHYLTDPINAEVVAGTIADAFKKADPAGAEAYESGRKAFVKKLHEALFGAELVDQVGGAKLSREAMGGTLDTFFDSAGAGGGTLRSKLGGWLGKMQPVRGRPLVTYHKDYSYFAQRFGVKIVDYVEPKPGIPPSAKHLEELVGHLKSGAANLIVTRPFVEHRSTDLLTEKTGVKVITLPLEVGGAPEATDFFKLFDLITDQISTALAKAPEAAR
ncbi:MAG TPA: metal ABC transporter substrate-binding protein [Candidatus Polarisedimenticolia bacterium]|nr:metal ABC transporter substrate-binding protein [Candidatus Polarisedimenticolia bacterium]